jgi:hypothetical protein
VAKPVIGLPSSVISKWPSSEIDNLAIVSCRGWLKGLYHFDRRKQKAAFDVFLTLAEYDGIVSMPQKHRAVNTKGGKEKAQSGKEMR